MKVIISTNGTEILVDDSDFEMLNKYSWRIHEYKNNTKYAETGKSGIKMHRMILDVSDNSILIDHKDRDGLNNQRDNLRLATKSTNSMNKLANGEVKYKGVCIQRQKQKYFHKGTNTWKEANTSDKIRARIKVNGKSINLGSFKTIEEAALAYNEAAIKYHVEFAVLNNIN